MQRNEKSWFWYDEIPVNPIDWDSEMVQAGECYEVIRRYGKQVIIMEAVKGGAPAAEDIFCGMRTGCGTFFQGAFSGCFFRAAAS